MNRRFSIVLVIIAIVMVVVVYTYIASWLEENRKDKKPPQRRP